LVALEQVALPQVAPEERVVAQVFLLERKQSQPLLALAAVAAQAAIQARELLPLVVRVAPQPMEQ